MPDIENVKRCQKELDEARRDVAWHAAKVKWLALAECDAGPPMAEHQLKMGLAIDQMHHWQMQLMKAISDAYQHQADV